MSNQPHYQPGRWCRDCGHEAHPDHPCTYRLSQSRAIQMLARGGRDLRALGLSSWPPKCDCEEHLRGRRR